MQTFADQIEVLNTHRRIIHKVLRCFGRKSSKNTKTGGWTDQFRGVCLALGPSGIFWREVTSSGNYQARLGELGGNHLPHFCYKMAWGAEEKRFSTLGNQISLKISEEKKKEGENPCRDASVMFTWLILLMFFAILRSFFIVHRSSTG